MKTKVDKLRTIKYRDEKGNFIRNVNPKNFSSFLENVLNGEINESNAGDEFFNSIQGDYNYILENPIKDSKDLQNYVEKAKNLVFEPGLEPQYTPPPKPTRVNSSSESEKEEKQKVKQRQKVAEKIHLQRIKTPPKSGTGLKILTPSQLLTRLPILLVQKQARNNSQKLNNEIRQIIYSLYSSRNLSKTIYNHLINTI